MKNMRKRILSLMVVLMMSLSLVQPTAFAAGNESGENQEQGLNIQTVVVDSSADSTPDSTDTTTPDQTPPTSEGNPEEGQAPSGGDEKTNDSDESAKPELVNPDGSINPDAVERPGQSDTVEVTPGPVPEDTDADTDAVPPAGETDPGEEAAPPAGDTSSDEEDVTPPAKDDVTPPPFAEEEDKNSEIGSPWDVFYDEENDTYKLTFNIGENAEGNQVLDLTNALKLLNDYSNNLKDNAGPSKTVYNDDVLADLFYTVPTENDYPQDLLDIAASIGKDAKWLDTELLFHCRFGDPLNSSFKAALDKWNAEAVASKLDLPNVLQPGDIRKFEFYLTSDSKHVYKYKDGSFILATPEWNTTDGEFTGFDGQILPGEYIDEAKYHVTLRCEPIRELLETMGYDEFAVFNGPNKGEDARITRYLKENYGGETVAESMNNYLLAYYNTKDGTEYTSIDELIKNNADAKAELTKTETSGNKWFTLSGEKFVVDAHLETVKYDNFYKELFSFAFGDTDDVEKFLGEMKFNTDTNLWEYENNSWTDNGYQKALYYYMSHQEIWAETNQYFAKMLESGLTAGQAIWPSFMMALNIDGELTGNDWQDTKWPWYSSIELEQMDFSFNLTKTDMETGEIIADSETGFAIWYNKDDGTKMYCQRDENGDYYFDTTEAFVTTTSGSLNIDFALLKDIVYYLQEVNAPDGYEKDPTVYLIMNQEDYDTLSENVKAQIEAETGGNHGFLDLTVSEDGLSVSTEFGNVKIVTPPDRPTPTPTPDPDPDPDPDEPDIPDPDVPLVPGPDPEEPPVDIPEEDPPLVDIPEEEPPLVDMPDLEVPLAPRPSTPTKPTPKPPVTTVEVDIPDEEVPLADVPNTGDDTGLWCALGLAAGAGLAYLFLEEKKRQNSAR